MNPRTLWACQPVASMISARVAPFARWIRVTTVALLLPSRATPVAAFSALGFFWPVGRAAFFAGVLFFPDFTFPGATRGFCGAVLGFFSAFWSWVPALAASAV